jgi:hypothetical protein
MCLNVQVLTESNTNRNSYSKASRHNTRRHLAGRMWPAVLQRDGWETQTNSQLIWKVEHVECWECKVEIQEITGHCGPVSTICISYSGGHRLQRETGGLTEILLIYLRPFSNSPEWLVPPNGQRNVPSPSVPMHCTAHRANKPQINP